MRDLKTQPTSSHPRRHIHMGPPNRYIDRSLSEGELISKGAHFPLDDYVDGTAGIHAGNTSCGKREATTPNISSIQKALRLPRFFARRRRGNAISTTGVAASVMKSSQESLETT
jgi:hypothetical protein